MSEDEELASLFIELLNILEIEEESDSGRTFRPNQITSCRAMDLDKIDKILTMAREIKPKEYQ